MRWTICVRRIAINSTWHVWQHYLQLATTTHMYKAKELTSGSRASSAAFSVGVAAAPSFGVDSTFFDDFFLRKETLCAVEFERGGKRKKKVRWDGLKVVTQTIIGMDTLSLTFFIQLWGILIFHFVVSLFLDLVSYNRRCTTSNAKLSVLSWSVEVSKWFWSFDWSCCSLYGEQLVESTFSEFWLI